MSLVNEIICYGTCIKASDILIPIVVFLGLAGILFAAFAASRSEKYRLASFSSAQGIMVVVFLMVFIAMECSRMFTINAYILYALISGLIVFLIPRFFDRLLVRKLKAEPISDLITWPQDFVNNLVHTAKVYYFDSAYPKAMASGNSIFISVGMLESFGDDELKAVLAHEAWHVRHNKKTPFLRQLSYMTFIPHHEDGLEAMADAFAAKIVGVTALVSARSRFRQYHEKV